LPRYHRHHLASRIAHRASSRPSSRIFVFVAAVYYISDLDAVGDERWQWVTRTLADG